ncbi:hypothetical protein [Corynebacterium lubricantis]|uniref:hypothetical protein n=1 Tax=Corynebacterium lubricantis TaxID=541095 RepID=UPI00036A68BD|nr:hypothetical protein [Corynebacterium lubricantis]
MAYDFVLFAPDEKLLLGSRAWQQLRLRLDKAETTTTEELLSLRDTINAQAQHLPQEGITLADSTTIVRGDRCLVVSVTEDSLQDAAVWLLSLATQQHLGLATATDKEVILVGDEITEFSTETASLDLPVVSPGSVKELLREVESDQVEAADDDFVANMLIVSDNEATEQYLQATYSAESADWLVELRQGSVAKHWQTRIASLDEVQSIFSSFINRDKGLRSQYPWKHLEIPEAAIDYRDHDH